MHRYKLQKKNFNHFKIQLNKLTAFKINLLAKIGHYQIHSRLNNFFYFELLFLGVKHNLKTRIIYIIMLVTPKTISKPDLLNSINSILDFIYHCINNDYY